VAPAASPTKSDAIAAAHLASHADLTDRHFKSFSESAAEYASADGEPEAVAAATAREVAEAADEEASEMELPSARATRELARRAAANGRSPTPAGEGFSTRGPIVEAPTRMNVSSMARAEIEARAEDDADSFFSGTNGEGTPRRRTGYLSGREGPVANVGRGVTARLAASQIQPRTTSATVYASMTADGTPAADLYSDYFDGLPQMHAATKEVLARSHSVANPRRMGYADARPDITPTSRFGLNPDHAGERVGFDFSGAEGRATAAFAAGLRPSLYTPSKYEAPKTGREYERAWASTAGGGNNGSGRDGGGVAPSDTVAGYAYRHAAALSQWVGVGNVYDRLTDTRGYTGLHRHRFDGDGRGLGMRGRDGGSVDHKWLDNSFPVKGAWYLSDPGTSGYGRQTGMARARNDGTV
jgi:hypothetical protein